MQNGPASGILAFPSTLRPLAGATPVFQADMYGSPAFRAPIFYERPDRRDGRRCAYPAVVRIDGRAVPGRDISPRGLSILLPAPQVGDIVHVTLAPASEGTPEISSPARVARVEPSPEGIVVGLEFLDD